MPKQVSLFFSAGRSAASLADFFPRPRTMCRLLQRTFSRSLRDPNLDVGEVETNADTEESYQWEAGEGCLGR